MTVLKTLHSIRNYENTEILREKESNVYFYLDYI